MLLQEAGGPGEERGLSLADSIAIAYSIAYCTGWPSSGQDRR
jgi:hypothetical protein